MTDMAAIPVPDLAVPYAAPRAGSEERGGATGEWEKNSDAFWRRE
jgi:hypothetical protein